MGRDGDARPLIYPAADQQRAEIVTDIWVGWSVGCTTEADFDREVRRTAPGYLQPLLWPGLSTGHRSIGM